jgi:sugar/nucleoside kinase (ribokinase family)
MRISAHSRRAGGQVATAMCTCAAMGLRAKYVGAVGNDDNARLIRDELTRRGIDATDIVVRECASAFAVILVDEVSGERIVLWHRDEGLRLRPGEVPLDAVAAARVVHVDDVDQETAIAAARAGRGAGRIVTSDIDQVTPRTEDLVSAVTIPMFAEHVPQALTGESDIERGLRKLRRLNDGVMTVTLGARGAAVLEGDRFYEEPGFAVAAVDTTGAGDVFRGAFIAALLRGESTRDAVRFANAAAAVSCTRPGAIGGVPTREETAALLQRATDRC